MRHLFLTIFFSYPIQYSSTTIIIKIHINIRQRNTVGIQETFEQQIVCNRVYFSDTQTICYGRTCRRSTSRPYRHVQFFTRGTNKILHNQEVTRKTHRLHNMKFEFDPFLHFLIQDFSITLVRTFQR